MARAGRRKIAYRASRAPLTGKRVSEYRLPLPQDVDPDAGWYLVYTNPNCERRAMLGLERAGYRAFIPSMRRVIEKPHAKPIEKIVPMFPRYLFVSGRQRTMIRTIDGVQDVVRNGLDWAPVPAAAIRFMLEHQDKLVKVDLEPKFKVGTRVRVQDGPFASFCGVVDKVLGQDRAHVLVEIFGRDTPVDLHLDQMAAA